MTFFQNVEGIAPLILAFYCFADEKNGAYLRYVSFYVAFYLSL